MVFHLDLSKESITHLTFRLTPKTNPEFDVEGLAKAAVNGTNSYTTVEKTLVCPIILGDETALDMFSNWRPKTTARKFRIQDGSDNFCFFLATQQGSIYYVNSR